MLTALEWQPEEWKEKALEMGLAAYRGQQIFRALHQEQISAWSELRQLKPPDRERLAAAVPLAWPSVARRIASQDGTIRYLLQLSDGKQVEAVYLPDEEFDGDGRLLRRRTTFCISSQVGCAVNCQFCLTATLGLARSLTAGEIVGQVLVLLREHGLRPGRGVARHFQARGAGFDSRQGPSAGALDSRERPPVDRVNLVFMGQGEPFLNYAAVVRALQLLTRPEGAGLAARRITVSTSGIVDKIGRWGRESFPHGRPRLAISLNASSDEQRQRLMPHHRAQGGMEGLFAAVRAFAYQPREYITFEYVLLAGINDQPEDAARVAALLGGLRAKVNLIAWNMGGELPFRSPEPAQVLDFQRRLIAAGIPTYIRRPRGRDIYAACGQLSAAGRTSPATTVRN